MNLDMFRLTFDRYRLQVFKGIMPLSQAKGIRTDQNLTHLGQTAQPGCKINGVSRHTMSAFLHVHFTCNHKTGVDTRMHENGLPYFLF